ncbi:1-acyl-sn-glycerol-3-phosphate acyltransferase 3 [Rhynchospora pubera]|uniref:1-acylglycerol-3-phosphate O-acyltransferase n=1 Tax=Rhynchospora pubera TaxID=906938 RepID=A0AAV8HGY9_9POAL|nr:1-acyl-sn-glycerol-3-phosphate acyltransferase 3 [Rhynchospora pubera]
MAVPAVLVLVPLGLLFLLSGLVVNCIQGILFVIIRPFSRNLYRRINRLLAELLWLQLIWLVDWWAGVKVELHGDAEIFNLMGKEHALLVSNHRSDIDWLVGWVLAQRAGCLGSTLAVMKKSSKFLPVIGWSMWFAEYLFLERSWAKDENTLKVGLKRLEDFPVPLWLALFVEGTRFTPAKLLAAQEFAAANGLHVPRNVLVPRTKGFVASVSIMRSFVPAIYDTTVIIPKDQPSPTMMRILRGQSSVVHVHMKRRAMSELPQTDDEVSQWCKDLFVAKDALLDRHIAEGSFGGEVRSLGRPVKSLVVVIFWSSILSYAIFRFFQWSQLLSTWKGAGFTAVGLALVTMCMQVFIAFSQAERSSTAKAARNRVKKE